MKRMAFEMVGSLMLTVHAPDPPSKEEWDAYVALAKEHLERIGSDRMRSLNFTEGGGPSLVQRQQINDVLKGRPTLAAVVTSNAFVRGIVVALAVFNPKIKAFRPEAVADAFRYLSISETESKLVWRAVARLEAQLGLRGNPGRANGE